MICGSVKNRTGNGCVLRTKHDMLWIILGIYFMSLCTFGESKVYTRCGLTNELLNRGFSRSLVGNWICMIESESQKDTSKEITKANGSKSLGLFQINSKEWCKYGTPGGKCNIKCENLINEDISDDAVCARKVEREYGFRAWEGWVRGCYRRNWPLPNC